MNYINAILVNLIAVDGFNEDVLSNDAKGDTANDFFVDGNNMDLNRLLDNLREEIKFDESIAMKSAMLLKLLEVGIF